MDSALDIAWILICAAMVMLMQAGFSCLESGLVRTKNSINVATKNFVDFCVSSAVFWLFGFALMFGLPAPAASSAPPISLFDPTGKAWLAAFFVFQMGFCGTATTIISGAVAERMRFAGYLAVTVVMAAVIYPVMGHWVWGSAAGLSVRPAGSREWPDLSILPAARSCTRSAAGCRWPRSSFSDRASGASASVKSRRSRVTICRLPRSGRFPALVRLVRFQWRQYAGPDRRGTDHHFQHDDIRRLRRPRHALAIILAPDRPTRRRPDHERLASPDWSA